jgi:hypothetical protein
MDRSLNVSKSRQEMELVWSFFACPPCHAAIPQSDGTTADS